MKLRLSPGLAALLLLAALVQAAACGGTTTVDSGTGGAGGADATSSTTSTTSTSSTEVTTTSSTVSTATGVDECAAFKDETTLGTAPLHIVNQTGQTIFLQTNCGSVSFDVVSNPEDGKDYAPGFICFQSCEAFQTSSGTIDCGPCAPTVYKLDVGASADVGWSGLTTTERAMPAACYQDKIEHPSCQQVTAAPAGQYDVIVKANNQCDNFGSPCDCSNGSSCIGQGTGFAAQATATFKHPGGNAQLVFEPCAFGCPGTGPSGGGG